MGGRMHRCTVLKIHAQAADTLVIPERYGLCPTCDTPPRRVAISMLPQTRGSPYAKGTWVCHCHRFVRCRSVLALCRTLRCSHHHGTHAGDGWVPRIPGGCVAVVRLH